MSDFAPFAYPDTTSGTPRKCGVEIEFAGLSETAVAEVLAEHFGGTARDSGPNELVVEGTALGDLRVELDTVWRKAGLPIPEAGMELVREIVPVEIITAPLTPAEVAQFDSVLSPLREAGAIGSRGGVLLGFGVHLNPEVTGLDDPHTLATIRAFGLLEDHLRRSAGIDTTRRLLPFVDPWPPALIDDLVANPPQDMGAMMALYARHTKNRNHGLDLLPLSMEYDPDRHSELFPKDKTSPRPAFHFRLPDSRIDEPDWSLQDAWQMWAKVEETAADADRMTDLEMAWRAHRARAFSRRGPWAERVGALLGAA
ncbi:amidoligase family protein [Tropicibacter alexandrii]|uniref:amidoligase family protein n=1 Tax=Tropicibacter alexandrii TaxID=2267683 RepID=UPI000EF50177|nr:amidoligase family protein [Tropicibacter alexandrii]